MSTFTALHRVLGSLPGPITSAMLQEAVDQSASEQADLDWKRQLPSQPLPEEWRTEFAKDVAAMANAGGGLLVYGVDSSDGKASKLINVGMVDERLEDALRKIAVSGITPPVFNLEMHRVGDEGCNALVVEVPASSDVPHLIYRRNDADFHFAAPVRNGPFTAYMNERQIEQMYRARFGEGANATEYESLQARWLIGTDPVVMHQQVHDLAIDAINQGGVENLSVIVDPGRAKVSKSPEAS